MGKTLILILYWVIVLYLLISIVVSNFDFLQSVGYIISFTVGVMSIKFKTFFIKDPIKKITPVLLLKNNWKLRNSNEWVYLNYKLIQKEKDIMTFSMMYMSLNGHIIEPVYFNVKDVSTMDEIFNLIRILENKN